jgi:hypothetical protein
MLAIIPSSTWSNTELIQQNEAKAGGCAAVSNIKDVQQQVKSHIKYHAMLVKICVNITLRLGF